MRVVISRVLARAGLRDGGPASQDRRAQGRDDRSPARGTREADGPGAVALTTPDDKQKSIERLREADESSRALRAARRLRELLRATVELGDPLSTAGEEPSQLIARRVAETASDGPA